MMHRIFKSLMVFAVLAWAGTMLWQTNKPLPMGVHVMSSGALSEARLLTDLTYRTARGEPRYEQQIFDAVLQQIDTAHSFIVMDYFLFNDDRGAALNSKPLRALSREVADHLLARKRADAALQILVITDPINDMYGGATSALFSELQQAHIEVVRTDLTMLRDSNAAYSAVWRGLLQWWGNSNDGGWLANPFDAASPPVTLRSWFNLLNFKANHRKVIVTDRADGSWQALVASANPHDASSAHSNVALQFSGALVQQVLDSELEIARFSGWRDEFTLPTQHSVRRTNATFEGYYLTEGAIAERTLRAIRDAQAGDQIMLAMFYLSHRPTIDAIKRAIARGVQVRMILDPNKDAFGIRKDGVPNRSVANELMQQRGVIDIRWYRTAGEQFHTKLLMVQKGEQLFMTLGSANFTRRNLDDYNLEANVVLTLPADSELARQATRYFDRLWQGDALTPEYTAPFGAYQDTSMLRYWRYRFMEATGLSTF